MPSQRCAKRDKSPKKDRKERDSRKECCDFVPFNPCPPVCEDDEAAYGIAYNNNPTFLPLALGPDAPVLAVNSANILFGNLLQLQAGSSFAAVVPITNLGARRNVERSGDALRIRCPGDYKVFDTLGPFDLSVLAPTGGTGAGLLSVGIREAVLAVDNRGNAQIVPGTFKSQNIVRAVLISGGLVEISESIPELSGDSIESYPAGVRFFKILGFNDPVFTPALGAPPAISSLTISLPGGSSNFSTLSVQRLGPISGEPLL
jgi:hypothetical protein